MGSMIGRAKSNQFPLLLLLSLTAGSQIRSGSSRRSGKLSAWRLPRRQDYEAREGQSEVQMVCGSIFDVENKTMWHEHWQPGKRELFDDFTLGHDS
jgi:hypothetical protein